jgi:hypothetical protein
MAKYDVVWYWEPEPGIEAWIALDPSPEAGVEVIVRELSLQGYVARRGLRMVGPPEGPPDERRLAQARELGRHSRAFQACRLCGSATRYRSPQGEPICGGH